MISNFLEILILSIVQGISEFLPISSSAHLFLVSEIYKFKSQSLLVDVGLHLGSLLAIIFYFRNELKEIVNNKNLLFLMLLGSLPLIILGGIIYKTGLIKPKQLRLSDWKALRVDTDLAYLFQILIYSYVHADTISRYKESSTGIISFRNLPEYFMPFELKIDHSYALSKDNLKNFEKVLFELIGEIFNSRIPFKASI